GELSSGQERDELIGGGGRQARQQLAGIGPGVEAPEVTRRRQAGQKGQNAAAAIRAQKKPSLSSKRKPAPRPPRPAVVYLQIPNTQVNVQGGPLIGRVGQRLADRGFRQSGLLRAVEPNVQRVEQRPGLLLPQGGAGRRL